MISTKTYQSPKIAGFTFIRNALKYDYPIVEAITSILPICDYFVVAVGKSEDTTLELIKSINDSKIHIIETIWNENLKTGGRVLAAETQKAFDAIPNDFDWCFYIQGDECVHEDDLPTIKSAIHQWHNDPKTEGFAFKYRHFYGSYDFIAQSRRWYRREIRIMRNDKNIFSYKDAQGFRWNDNRKLNVRILEAHIHHYGWVKPPDKQQKKQQSFHLLWHSPEKVQEMVGNEDAFKYDHSQLLKKFDGTHPKVIVPRIEATNWLFKYDASLVKLTLKDKFSLFMENKFGWLPGEYRNYKRI
jgi:hypothetical protein